MHTHAHTTVPVFIDEGHPTVLADTDTRPEYSPAMDAFGRWVGNLAVQDEADAGDARPTHAPRTAFLEAELFPEGIMRAADGRLLAQFRLASLGGAKIECGAIVYMELNPAAPVGAVWDALFAAAYPAAVEG